MKNDRHDRTTRRGFLTAAGTTGLLVGVGGIGAAGVGRQDGAPATEYRFGGRISGWQGREPASIADTVNPTLNLQAGTEYAITWVNVDGAPHNVAILAENGDVVEQTEIISGQGGTQTLQFTATEEMTSYICQVHPTSMVGDIVIGGGDGGQQTTTATQTAVNQTTTPGQTTAANQTTTPANQTTTTVPNPTEAEVEETTNPLADQYGEQPVKFFAAMEPPQGVRTEATGMTWFTLHPPNGVVAKLMYSTHVENVENVTGIDIVLTERTNPVVANLFRPRTPVDETNGTLVDEIMRAEDLVGPFEGEPLLRLTEAIRNDNARVVIRTTDHPDGVLVGSIREVDGTTDRATTMADGANQTTAGGNESEGQISVAGQASAEGGVDTDDIVSQAQAPGFGGLSALGGLAGAVGYMLKRGDGDDD
ncbi:cupredoxin domain-containing protein [Halorussus lipolyticus]|uniref:cupredoxin domain-containing protein n=1 Tax=Halorussus lipolyticus TaxID=3034024 RepID=UPI0023E86AB4|nr:plastocyanin/azurin family copper-binding protein [Halorussus sp. DT80]